MKRRILLIKGHSNSNHEEYIMNEYLNYYKIFFESNSGGAFEPDEIKQFKTPTVPELKDSISIEKSDFVIIVLIGHGATKEDYQLFKISENTVIKAGQLKISAPKQIIIVESCRSLISKVEPIDLSDKIPLFKDGGIIRMPIDRKKAKELYNKQIEESNHGIAICFACSKGEEAQDFNFSKSLLQSAFDWHLNIGNNLKVLKINELMFIVNTKFLELAKKEKALNQNPELIGITDLPFVVSKF